MLSPRIPRRPALLVLASLAVVLIAPSVATAVASSGTPNVSSTTVQSSEQTADKSLPPPVDGVRPGPSILYQPEPQAPQFSNAGVWQAQPTRVCMTSAYRAGEFLYQGCLWDDHGGGAYQTWPLNTLIKDYTYPTGPNYRSNAANIVEVRLKPLATGTAFRITYNTMLDGSLVGTTLALGDSAQPRPAPHHANTVLPAQFFVTVHGNSGDIVDAATGKTLPTAPTVNTGVARRQVDVVVPYSVFDPRGQHQVRIAAAAGLWDNTANEYLVPHTGEPTATTPGGAPLGDAAPSAFFDVAFRYTEPITAPWRDEQQLAAIGKGDISQFYATVDFTKLAAGTNDDMTGQPTGVPAYGYMQRIYASSFELGQGLRQPTDPYGPPHLSGTQQNSGRNGLESTPLTDPRASLAFGWPCRDRPGERCVPDLAGNLQRYTVYIPRQRPAAGYGMFLWTPGYAITPNDSIYGPKDIYQAVGNRPGLETIVVNVDGRGADEWYYGESGASVFEAWHDIATMYQLDPTRTTIAGFSSGAYGANKLALQFPDVFGKAFVCDGLDEAPSFPGINAVTDKLPVDTLTQHEAGSKLTPLLPSRYNQPVMEWAGLNDDFIPYDITRERGNAYAAGNYDYEFVTWTGLAAEHLQMCNNGTFGVMTPWLGASTRTVDPARVVYVRDPQMDDSEAGLVGDHAYWLSGIQTRGPQPAAPGTLDTDLGTIDVTTQGFGTADRTASVPAKSIGSTASDGFPIGLRAARTQLPVNAYTREARHYGPPSAAPVKDELDIKATNISTVTVDPQRAKVDCAAKLQVTTDGPLTVTLTGCGTYHFTATSTPAPTSTPSAPAAPTRPSLPDSLTPEQTPASTPPPSTATTTTSCGLSLNSLLGSC
jgi:hypothetical protein